MGLGTQLPRDETNVIAKLSVPPNQMNVYMMIKPIYRNYSCKYLHPRNIQNLSNQKVHNHCILFSFLLLFCLLNRAGFQMVLPSMCSSLQLSMTLSLLQLKHPWPLDLTLLDTAYLTHNFSPLNFSSTPPELPLLKCLYTSYEQSPVLSSTW